MLSFQFRGLVLLLLAVGLPVGAAELNESHEKGLTLSFNSQVLLITDEVSITEAEIESYLNEVPSDDLAGFLSSPRRLAEGVQRQADNQRLALRGIEAGILEDAQVSADVYRSVMRQLASRHVERVVSSQLLSDYSERARELYLAEPDRFREPTTYSFTHLLIRTDDRGETEAMRQILSVKDQLESGTDFEELVREFSEDPAAEENEGVYEKVALDSLDRNFARSLRSMDSPGLVDEPVRSQFGWHLIRLDAIHDGDTLPWDEAKSRAVQLAEQQHKQRIRKSYLDEVFDTANLETVPDLIERFQERYRQSTN